MVLGIRDKVKYQTISLKYPLWSWTAGCQAWPARLLTMLQILLATLGAAAVQTKDEGYPVLSAALLASIVLGLHMSVEALEKRWILLMRRSRHITMTAFSKHSPSLHWEFHCISSFSLYWQLLTLLISLMSASGPKTIESHAISGSITIGCCLHHLCTWQPCLCKGHGWENQEAWQSQIHRLKKGQKNEWRFHDLIIILIF